MAVGDGCGGGSSNIPPPSLPSFQNPSFEATAVAPTTFQQPGEAASLWVGDPNWGLANGTGAWGTGGGHTGAQYAYVQGATADSWGGLSRGTIEQTVTGFTVGAKYVVTFWMATRHRIGGGDNFGTPVTLTANGLTILGSTAPIDDFEWRKYTSDAFTATDTSYHFKWRREIPTSGHNDHASLIDDVQIELAR